MTLSPIVTSSMIDTEGPIYTLSPITAALPSLLPIVTNYDKLTLLPITAVGLQITGPP